MVHREPRTTRYEKLLPNSDLFIGVSLCYASHSVIHILKPCTQGGNFRLKPLATVSTPKEQDLVDFAITPNEEIWAVFRSPQGETSVAKISINYTLDWEPCILESPLDRDEIPFDDDIDAKQNYLDFIFQPGRFPLAVIAKALSIYRKSTVVTDTGVPPHLLRDRVAVAVDTEISIEIQSHDCSEDDSFEVANRCWQRFYACCVEYYESGTRPIGLLLLAYHIPPVRDSSSVDTDVEEDDNRSESSRSSQDSKSKCGEIVTAGVVLIKKNYISLLRPMETLETITYSIGTEIEDLKNEIFYEDNQVSTDLIRLVLLLTYLDDNIPTDFKIMFDKSLKQLKSPLQAVAEIFSKDVSVDNDESILHEDVLINLSINLSSISSIFQVINSLLDILDFGQPDLNKAANVENSKWLIHLGHLFSSQCGMSFVSNSLYQIVKVRYDLCRCILVLQHLLLTNALQKHLSKERFFVTSEMNDRPSLLTQCYFLLLWISTVPVHLVLPLDSLESSIGVLKLCENNKSSLLSTSYQHNRNITLLQLFLQSTASSTVRLLLSQMDIPHRYICLWQQSFLPFCSILAQLMWPICNNTIFAEFLLSSNQYLHVQEYTRLLGKWCYSNSYTRKFMLACSLLDCGEHYKSFDMFNKAAHGVTIEEFIKTKVLQVSQLMPKERLTVIYYLKVIKLFEQQGLSDLVIQLAKQAIELSTKNDPELPTLYSIVFLNHLQLGQYEAAYESLVSNPDRDRKKDCLRQLVVTLFECRMLKTLFNFSFDGMQNDLERIIEMRARSLDVMDNDYYNFLYAFHTLKGTKRKGACVMYEQALRLSQDNIPTSLDFLERQCHCYIATINSLSLVKKEDAWIVKPLPSYDEKNNYDGDSTTKERYPKNLKNQVEVLELEDIRKEYLLCKAKLKLIKFSPEHCTNFSSNLSAHEIIGLLSNARLYKDALNICQRFGITPDFVLASLAANCVSLDENPAESAWDWLAENDVTDLGDGSAADLAWNLLESLLKKHEREKESGLHRAVTSKLLQLGVFLPHWLVASYKLRNPAELLRVLLDYGRLQEASIIAVEYIEAMLGKGKEFFNIKFSLSPHNPSTWLPFNTIDIILVELEIHGKEDQEYMELYESLSNVLDKYLVTAEQVSQDKILLVHKQMKTVLVG